MTFGHHLLAYVEMFSARRERMLDCRKRVNRLPLGAAALAGTSYPIDRHARRHDARLRRRLRELARRRVGPRLRHRIHGGGRARHDARLALVRRTRAVDEPARRLHRSGRPLLHRLVDHAAEEEPGRARTRARQDRPRQRPPDGAADADEGPAARLQQGQSGRQGTAVRHRRYGGRHAAHLRRDGRRHHGQARRDARRRAAGFRDGHRSRRLSGQARPAVPRCARSGRARGARRGSRGCDLAALAGRTATLLAADRRRRVRRADAGRFGRRRNHVGGTAPGPGSRRHRPVAQEPGSRAAPGAHRQVRDRTQVRPGRHAGISRPRPLRPRDVAIKVVFRPR